MDKTYLRYVPRRTLGMVVSPTANLAADLGGRVAFSAALEDVNVWNVRQGALLRTLHDDANFAEVSALASSPDDTHVAAGCVFCARGLRAGRRSRRRRRPLNRDSLTSNPRLPALAPARPAMRTAAFACGTCARERV